ncbi:MAG: hypothetical protein LM517_09905 [Nitrosomonas sp.]|nr:hypothetical protein [Nitrosomonas sp.]
MESKVSKSFDATYQYLGNMAHIFELQATSLKEQHDMNASGTLRFVGEKFNSMDTARIRAGYISRLLL